MTTMCGHEEVIDNLLRKVALGNRSLIGVGSEKQKGNEEVETGGRQLFEGFAIKEIWGNPGGRMIQQRRGK